MNRFTCPLIIGLALGAGGCLPAGNYHSAKPIGNGESSFGLTFSATSYAVGDDRVSIPAVIPEVTYHVGVSDDVEVGGRVAIGALAMEADVKYRFFKSPELHLAIAPAIAYQSLIVIDGTTVRLPVIATYDVAPNFGLTVAGFGSATRYSTVGGDDAGDDLGAFGGSWISTGASVGVEIRAATFEIRPAIEFTRFVNRFDGGDDNSSGFNTVNVLVHLAWIGGREKKQLNRMEQKIDQLGGQ